MTTTRLIPKGLALAMPTVSPSLPRRACEAPEDTFEVVFVPPHIRLQPSKLPHTVNFLVVVLVGRVRVTSLLLDLVIGRGKAQVRSTKLMVTNDRVLRYFDPLGGSEKVLSLQ